MLIVVDECSCFVTTVLCAEVPCCTAAIAVLAGVLVSFADCVRCRILVRMERRSMHARSTPGMPLICFDKGRTVRVPSGTIRRMVKKLCSFGRFKTWFRSRRKKV